MATEKPIKALILDSGPIIKNEPSASTLLGKTEKLVTTPGVISEIRDATTRARVETTLMPFLEVRQPSAAAVTFVQDFAKRTGDLAVLSRPDIEIIALAYELECEMNGGDWRLRREPGQKRTNGPAPKRSERAPESAEAKADEASENASEPTDGAVVDAAPRAPWASGAAENSQPRTVSKEDKEPNEPASNSTQMDAQAAALDIDQRMSMLGVNEQTEDTANHPDVANGDGSGASDSDSDGWITQSNIKRRQLEDAGTHGQSSPEPQIMQVATVTTDFAMQNVLLRINLNLLSLSLQRVKHLKTYILRCHACFQTTKDMTKQFCPRCGQPALTRVACSTNANGEFKLHLKKNMQWNHRGDRYSIPKPTSGAANGRVKGGGKGSWGNDLILAEDQKEYTRATDEERRAKKATELMDADYMPAMFSGSGKRDNKAAGRPRVGAGRTVNSRKR